MVDMVLRWTKLTDARGRKWKLCPLRAAMKRTGLSRAELVLPGETAPLHQAMILWGANWFVCLFGWLSYLEYSLGFGYDWLFTMPAAGYIFLISAVNIIGMGIFLHRTKWNTKYSVITAMTRAGCCPSCAYRVSDCEPEPDGCTVCPECGGAWRLDG